MPILPDLNVYETKGKGLFDLPPSPVTYFMSCSFLYNSKKVSNLLEYVLIL